MFDERCSTLKVRANPTVSLFRVWRLLGPLSVVNQPQPQSFRLCSYISRLNSTIKKRDGNNIEFVKHSDPFSTLRGLPGLDPDIKAIFYAFFCGYSGSKLQIHPESIGHDVNSLCDLAGRWEGSRGQVYCSERGGGVATAELICYVLKKRPRHLPTIIALTLHTELHDGRRAFMPADFPEVFSFDSPNIVPYSKLSQLLLGTPNTAPIALLTESCFSDNIMGLPWKCVAVRVGEKWEIRWETTGLGGDRKWELMGLMVQFAATMPEGEAATFKSKGSVYTQALCAAWSKPFGIMMTRIQNSMDLDLGIRASQEQGQQERKQAQGEQEKQEQHQRHRQQHVVYSSRKFHDDEIISSALGLTLVG